MLKFDLPILICWPCPWSCNWFWKHALDTRFLKIINIASSWTGHNCIFFLYVTTLCSEVITLKWIFFGNPAICWPFTLLQSRLYYTHTTVISDHTAICLQSESNPICTSQIRDILYRSQWRLKCYPYLNSTSTLHTLSLFWCDLSLRSTDLSAHSLCPVKWDANTPQPVFIANIYYNLWCKQQFLPYVEQLMEWKIDDTKGQNRNDYVPFHFASSLFSLEKTTETTLSSTQVNLAYDPPCFVNFTR